MPRVRKILCLGHKLKPRQAQNLRSPPQSQSTKWWHSRKPFLSHSRWAIKTNKQTNWDYDAIKWLTRRNKVSSSSSSCPLLVGGRSLSLCARPSWHLQKLQTSKQTHNQRLGKLPLPAGAQVCQPIFMAEVFIIRQRLIEMQSVCQHSCTAHTHTNR